MLVRSLVQREYKYKGSQNKVFRKTFSRAFGRQELLRQACGLQNEHIQQKLLSVADWTLAYAVEKAKSIESAQRNAQGLKESLPFRRIENLPHIAVHTPKHMGNWLKPCHCCGKLGHAHSATPSDTNAESKAI